MNAFRLPGLVIVIGLLAGGLLLDQTREAPAELVEAIGLPSSLVAIGETQAATWFCAASTPLEGGLADSEVLLANTQPTVANASISVYRGGVSPASGNAVDEIELPLEPQSITSLRLGDLAGTEVVSLAVEVDRGGVLVEKTSVGPTGVDRTACSTEASTTWVSTSGSTVPGSRHQLVIFNPFPDEVTLDIDFTSDVGTRRPEALTGLHVPARSARLVEVADFVAASEDITTFVRARSGRVVVESIQAFDGSAVPLGLSVMSAAPATASSWTFAGVTPAAGPARLTVVNPGDTEVRVDVEVFPAAGERFVEPFEVILQPGQRDIVELESTGRLAEISSFSLVARALGGDEIIAGVEQRPAVEEPDPLEGIVEQDDVDVPSTGFASSIGQPLLAHRLFTTVDIAEDDERSALHIFNPADDTIVRPVVRIAADGATRDVVLEVGPLRTLRVPLTELASGRYSLELISDASPIVASREITGLTSRSWAPLLATSEPPAG